MMLIVQVLLTIVIYNPIVFIVSATGADADFLFPICDATY
jgi:hypothetical protein